jgi:hypothetical protein
MTFPKRLVIATLASLAGLHLAYTNAPGQEARPAPVASEDWTFEKDVQPLLQKYCKPCHNAEDMESGVRVDQLNGELEDRRLFLWKGILKQVADEAMPPEDEPQLSAAERQSLTEWIRGAMDKARLRNQERNGAARRLTVSQYRNTLKNLLGLEEDLTGVLPPDGISKEGFVNNGQTMLLSPLLVETYFDIAEKALDLCIVDEQSKPVIQNFRMEFGKAINQDPFPDKLILGANSHLLQNEDFVVTELTPPKPFDYDPFRMRTKYRFIEGYQGNDTVRGWREYDSIYHAVFACMRGNEGYPKGHAYQTIPQGLLLRPAIPSAELFGVESTYGPKANFKISLRELPAQGKFHVTIRAARYDDGLLLDQGTKSRLETVAGAIVVKDLAKPQTVTVQQPGIYQADVYLTAAASVAPDASKLEDGLIGNWSLDGHASSKGQQGLVGQLVDGAKFVDSPFGGKAVLFDGERAAVVVPRDDSMNVGEGEFTVAAWIHPRGLRQGGIVSLGGYGYTHGWLLDMPDGGGVLRIETADSDNQSNGTVQSPAGVIQNNKWQHVAVVVRRGENETRLFVNGFEVAVGTIKPANLDNPTTELHIGRIPNANLFKGEIDEVRFYRRALDLAEIKALVQPGTQFVEPPPTEKRKNVTLTLNNRHFSGQRLQEAFLAVRLPAGPLNVLTQYDGNAAIDRVVFTPLEETDALARRFAAFEKRSPQIGIHVGLRRDCGSTLTRVGNPRTVAADELTEFVFEGAINNFPSPDVETDNVNYLAGVREIGVRSEYTDGRDLPRLLIRSIEFEGPFYESWPPATHRNIFIASDHQDDPPAYARDVIRSFASRAFRRPLADEELAVLLAVWESSFGESHDLQQSIKDTLLVVLTSPQFLFLIENSSGPQEEDLDAHELASKLSYFLWNAPPDERLLALAERNALHESLDAEVERLIQDPQFQNFAYEFASQWLSLEKFDVVSVDRKLFPTLTRDTKTELRKEPVQFLQYLIRQDLPLRNLVRSDFILANDAVANYYGLGDRVESGFEFVPVRHDNANLGGLLSQAGILAGLSDGRHANPIKRGAWLARKIIAEPPDDPPPNVPELMDEDETLTLREKLERHRDAKGCANCHAGIDPWGLPFEAFDAGGLFRKDTKVDARATLPDETEIRNLIELKDYLASDRIDRVAFSFMKHLASYAVGRSLNFHEVVFLEEEGLQLKSREYRMQDMIRFIVSSDLFLKK